ncbi:ABC transporter substrate-binding protein [Termitidicoccus mucosus]|uniref:Myristoyl transferase n=1 Tax=Termitidicoccus mucosus TaxID=1184151 RepID=A0A178IQE0_9BACT|nr:hypothetical protein AW736_03330 [Opitutaceae bacterium TSB47]
MNTNTKPRVVRLLALAIVALALAGPARAEALKKVIIGHTGDSCEAPVFAAYEKGFFRDEGLDVEMVKGDWNFFKEALAFGRISALQGLVMNYIKPIEQGLDAKFTAGIHRGCIHILSAKGSPIVRASDLKGRRIGVPALGSSPWVFAARVIGEIGGDIKRDVEWKPFPIGELRLALLKGEVDAIAISDPIGEILLSEGVAQSVVNQLTDAPYKDEYCCVAVVSGKLAREDPDAAARITRALLKASLWVEHNPLAAAGLSHRGRYVNASVELNARVLAKLDFVPSVEGARLAARTAAAALKNVGIVAPSTDVSALVERTFVRLPGLDDAWLKGVTVACEDRLSRDEILARPLPSSSTLDAAVAEPGCCAEVEPSPLIADSRTRAR